ncbi:hypothetical protein ASG43_10380 [Aureimonas sp. Leaf454]|uniref:ATP-grasp domain-containing protein n=1 Tax=Aureimonas sp. Leaf454 TaxID=1736381 RepID=UPI0006F3DD7F|nr:ATP-grasp domain-containing protein [Aureimonas sp. Leaf454]KQT47495.1 hypothetical protein ASG43_10380 [Aureimonas sp. Leaf454]
MSADRAEAEETPAGDLLIATFSGRSIAASARRARYRPLVADLFADNDLRDVAADLRIVRGDFVDGFDGGDLLSALEDLARGRDPVGVLCGPGFEDRPELLDAIAERWRLLGNTGDTVRRLKDPRSFAALCAGLGIAHPEIRMEPPAGGAASEWLVKRVGAAGGLHIGFLGTREPAPDRYYQRHVEGARRSALFVAANGKARILGFSEQWPSPSETEPFRYGGACGPIALDPATSAAVERAIRGIAAELPALVGLGSADFIVPDEGEPWLLEINPRPGATMDVFERDGTPALVAVHLDACEGRLPEAPLRPDGVRAAGFAYCDVDTVTIGAVDWPSFVSDRPVPGTTIRRGEPLFTLKADGASADDAITLFAARLSQMKTMIEEPEI